MTFLYLFLEFFKTGLFSVGGGLATIPFLQELAVNENYGWFSLDQLSDMIAVSESTPGPIGVNMATYAGYNAGFQISGIGTGILGGIVATLGIVCPAIIIICIISKFLEKFRDNKFVNYAFYGIRPAVAGLITGAMASVFVSAVFILGETGAISGVNLVASAAFVVLTALCAIFKKLHPIVFIALGALVGIIFGL
ncbi:MAG: chromate transporter [Ruminococcaceae bacterium]|nr:chromate transporter [Oscillospiraceae bacterium]